MCCRKNLYRYMFQDFKNIYRNVLQRRMKLRTCKLIPDHYRSTYNRDSRRHRRNHRRPLKTGPGLISRFQLSLYRKSSPRAKIRYVLHIFRHLLSSGIPSLSSSSSTKKKIKEKMLYFKNCFCQRVNLVLTIVGDAVVIVIGINCNKSKKMGN